MTQRGTDHQLIAEWSQPGAIIGRQTKVYSVLASTSDHAATLAGDPANDGLVICASAQTGGRGQYGRSWFSPTGQGVWLSVIVRPPREIVRPAILTAWAAVSVAEAIRPLVNRQPAIKWPNDVLLAGKKVCGILIEQGVATIVGIGLNVNQAAGTLAAAGLPDATSLAIVAQRSFEVDEVARAVIASLNHEYQLLLNGEKATLEACWKWRVGLLGRSVIVERLDGRKQRGRLREMAFDGVVLEQAAVTTVIPPEEIRHIFQTES